MELQKTIQTLTTGSISNEPKFIGQFVGDKLDKDDLRYLIERFDIILSTFDKNTVESLEKANRVYQIAIETGFCKAEFKKAIEFFEKTHKYPDFQIANFFEYPRTALIPHAVWLDELRIAKNMNNSPDLNRLNLMKSVKEIETGSIYKVHAKYNLIGFEEMSQEVYVPQIDEVVNDYYDSWVSMIQKIGSLQADLLFYKNEVKLKDEKIQELETKLKENDEIIE